MEITTCSPLASRRSPSKRYSGPFIAPGSPTNGKSAWCISPTQFDDTTWKMRWLVVDTGRWLPSRKVLIHRSTIGEVDDERRRVFVKLTKARIKDSPGILHDQPVSRQMEAGLYGYYGCDPSWGSSFYGMGAIAVPFSNSASCRIARSPIMAESSLLPRELNQPCRATTTAFFNAIDRHPLPAASPTPVVAPITTEQSTAHFALGASTIKARRVLGVTRCLMPVHIPAPHWT